MRTCLNQKKNIDALKVRLTLSGDFSAALSRTSFSVRLIGVNLLPLTTLDAARLIKFYYNTLIVII